MRFQAFESSNQKKNQFVKPYRYQFIRWVRRQCVLTFSCKKGNIMFKDVKDYIERTLKEQRIVTEMEVKKKIDN